MDSFYPQDDEAAPSESGSQTATEAPEEGEAKDKDQAGQTTLVPSSIFPEGTPEPGQRCTFEVVHCYENECELKYVASDDAGEQPGGDRGQGYKGAESAAMSGSLGKLNSMAA